MINETKLLQLHNQISANVRVFLLRKPAYISRTQKQDCTMKRSRCCGCFINMYKHWNYYLLYLLKTKLWRMDFFLFVSDFCNKLYRSLECKFSLPLTNLYVNFLSGTPSYCPAWLNYTNISNILTKFIWHLNPVLRRSFFWNLSCLIIRYFTFQKSNKRIPRSVEKLSQFSRILRFVCLNSVSAL